MHNTCNLSYAKIYDLYYTNICCRFLNAETRAELVYPELGSDPIIDTDSKTYNANLTGVLPELGIGSAPFYLTAVLSPILIIIMIVAAILLLVIGQKTIVHLPFAIVVSFPCTRLIVYTIKKIK